MAVTIVGSGSITGLSAGGLPTGSVTADSLATNSVDSDELVSGAIDAGHLASGVGGKVLQVVNSKSTSDGASSSSSTYADTGLSASITPSSTSNKILVTVIHGGCGKVNTDTYLQIKLLRGSTSILTFEGRAAENDATARIFIGACGCTHLDSPSTTSAVTYKTQFASQASSGHVYVDQNSESTITLMEIAG